MKASIYIPNELEAVVQNYLQDHPEMSLSSLVQEALEHKLKPRRNTLLELAGFVDSRKTVPRTLEQMLEDQQQRPEYEPTKAGFDRP